MIPGTCLEAAHQFSWVIILMLWLHAYTRLLVRSPWSDKKIPGKAGHNSIALPMPEGQREGNRICPALMETFMSLQRDLHSMGWRQMSLFWWWGGVRNTPGGAALGANSMSSWFFLIFVNKNWLLIELSYFTRRSTPHHMEWLLPWCFLEVAMIIPGRFPNNAWALIFKLKAELNEKGPIVPFATELAF